MSEIIRIFVVPNQLTHASTMYRTIDPYEQLLFPRDVGEIIPQGSPVRLISSILDQIDISCIESQYSDSREGRPGLDPRMMLKVIVYGYMNDIYSLRGLERAMERDAHLIWLAGYRTPDFTTISRFKSKCAGCIKEIFACVTEELAKRGEIDLEKELYNDGTTVRGRSSRYRLKWRKSAEKYSALADEKIQEGVRDLLDQIDDAQERGEWESHDHYSVEEARGIAVAVAQKLGGKGKKGMGKVNALRHACDKKEEHDKTVEACGGRSGLAPSDPDCGVMPAKEDGYDAKPTPNYNVQIATQNQYVTNFEPYDSPSDKEVALDFVDTCVKENGVKPEAVVQDAGYGCEEVYLGLEARGIQAITKFPMFDALHSRGPIKEGEFDEFGWRLSEDQSTVICPNGKEMRAVRTETSKNRRGFESTRTTLACDHCGGCPFKDKCPVQQNKDGTISRNLSGMRQEELAYERLTRPENLEKLQRRSVEPEPVFGQAKHNHGYRRFRHFGKAKVTMDLGFLFIAHNLRKLWKKQQKAA